MLNLNSVDYTFDYFGKPKEAVKENKKEQYNPYCNNEGTVLGK